MNPGKQKTQWKLLLDAEHFIKGDILETRHNMKLRVVSTPKKHYYKWYWRILNLLTFKLLFNPTIYYTVETVK